MSSIFGVYHLDGRPVEEASLAAMRDSLAHRDHDGGGLWQNRVTGMGHRALTTTPESIGEHLPLVCDTTGIVLTADARIDNRQELIATLQVDGGSDRVIRDSDLILAAYLKWGEQTPEHLIGDFAFAIWDARHRIIFCARDPMGVRPLYYHHRPGALFAFGSAIRAILACPSVPVRLNERKIADYLRQDFEDGGSTFYQEIFRVPAAHSLAIGCDSIRLRRYWSLDVAYELRLRSEREYADAFRELFVEAVRCRTRSAFPVGSTLSGGLDSSSIACAANSVLEEHQRPLRTFSLIFPDRTGQDLRRLDERSYIEAVLKTGDFRPSYVRADQLSPLQDWPRIAGGFDEACLAPNLYLHWELFRSAAANGVRVLLDGIDGDTTVSHGLPYLTELLRGGRLIRFAKEAGAFSRTYPAFPLRRLLWMYGILPAVPEAVVRTLSNQRHIEPESVVNRNLARRVPTIKHADGSARYPRTSLARRAHWQSLNSPLMQYIMDFADATSSAFALEVRYPFFDRRLMEFCLAIPADQKLRRGWTRAVLRNAMKGLLPHEVQWRKDKADLSPNFRLALRERDRTIIKDQVFGGHPHLDSYVDSRFVRDTYDRWVERPQESGRDGVTLFLVTTLGLWLQRLHPEGAEPARLSD